MGYEPPDHTDEEILADLADLEDKAAHWELEATLNPDVAAVCLDYAKHIRTMAECLRMDMMGEISSKNCGLIKCPHMAQSGIDRSSD